MPASIFGALASRRAGGTSVPYGSNSTPGGKRKLTVARQTNTPGGGQSGKTGASPHALSNATSDGFQFTDTLSESGDKTYPITVDNDWVSAVLTLTVTPTGNSATTGSILSALGSITLYAGGPIITMNSPENDIPTIAQRWSTNHAIPTVVSPDGTTAMTGTYNISGLNLPASKGPYSIEFVVVPAASYGTGTTALSVTISLTMKPGECPAGARFRYVSSTANPQPTDSSYVDWAQNTPVEGISLAELCIYGLTSNTADINYVQIIVNNVTITPKTFSSVLVSNANAQMNTALPSTVLFPLLALNTAITLGRTSHLFVQFGSSPATSGVRLGYTWFD